MKIEEIKDLLGLDELERSLEIVTENLCKTQVLTDLITIDQKIKEFIMLSNKVIEELNVFELKVSQEIIKVKNEIIKKEYLQDESGNN